MKNVKRSCVFFNEDFFWIHTQAVGMINVGDPLVEPEYLAPDVDDAMLGATLRQCLQKSRHIEMSEFQKMFKAGVFNQLDEERNQAAMQKYGYKTKRALYKNMLCCWISMFDGKVKIAPSHQKSVESYTATKDGPEPFTLHGPISDAELGAALREGFKRCTAR
ncbi:MAG: hypothetical protein RIQ69_1652 [Pseudomonadota bacterium]|jgi:hypothetical protein